MVDCVGGPRVNLTIYIDCVSPRIPNDLPKESEDKFHESFPQQLQRTASRDGSQRRPPGCIPTEHDRSCRGQRSGGCTLLVTHKRNIF